MARDNRLICHECQRSFTTLSGLTRHQTYSTKCVSEDIIWDTKPVVRMVPFGFAENSNSDSILLEDPVDTEFSSITTPVHIMESEIDYLNKRAGGDITACVGFSQEEHDIVLPPIDEIDQRGGHVYEILSHHDHDNSNLEENKYHPWANEDEFWITEWLITKAKISNKLVNELLHYIHQHDGCIEKIQIRSVRDIKKNIARVSSYTLVCNFEFLR